MSISNLHQYIIRKSSGEILHFHFFQNHFLGYKIYSENSRLYKTNIVVKESVLDYSVDIDDNDRVHLICLTKNGELRYYIGKDETWAHRVINVINMKTYVVRCLTFKLINRSLHIFYLIGDIMGSGLWTLKHLCWNGNEWRNFILGDIIAGKYPPPFYLDFDSKKNIYVIFRESDGCNTQICIKKYNTEFGIWGSQEKIQTNTEGVNQPFLLIDTNDSLHIAWSYLKDKNMQIAYKKRIYLDITKNSWGVEMSLSNPKANCSHPVLLEVEDKLYLIWNQDSIFYNRISYDMGETWSKPEVLFSSKNDKLFPFTYISNYKKDPRVKGNIVYGLVKEGIKLLIIEPFGFTSEMNLKISVASLSNKNVQQPYPIFSTAEAKNAPIDNKWIGGYERSENKEMEDFKLLPSSDNLVIEKEDKEELKDKQQEKTMIQEELINRMSELEAKMGMQNKENIEILNKKIDDLLGKINHLNEELKTLYEMVNHHLEKSQRKNIIKRIFDASK